MLLFSPCHVVDFDHHVFPDSLLVQALCLCFITSGWLTQVLGEATIFRKVNESCLLDLDGFSVSAIFINLADYVHDEGGVNLVGTDIIIERLEVSFLVVENSNFEKFKEVSEGINFDIGFSIACAGLGFIFYHFQRVLYIGQ